MLKGEGEREKERERERKRERINFISLWSKTDECCSKLQAE